MEQLPVLLTTREVAAACRVEVSTVNRWVRAGRVAAIRLPGGRVRIRQDVVDELLADKAL